MSHPSLKKCASAGETFIFTSVFLNALEPIAINYSVKIISPILFAGLYVFLCSILFFLYVIFTRTHREIFNKKAFKYILGVTILIVIIPSILIFTGSKMTSGINTALLLQIEILSTLIICSTFYKEKITSKKFFSSLLLLTGTVLILYNGTLNLNLGGLLIIAATFFYPFGNMCAKEALKLVHPAPILFLRAFLGGLSLIFISILFEKSGTQIFPALNIIITSIIIFSIILVIIAKIFWYKGLKTLEISKAIALSTISPGISLTFAIIFLREIPTIYQITGLIIIVLGVYFLTGKTKIASPSQPLP